MTIENKKPEPTINDPLTNYLENVSKEPDWQYFGLRKKDVSSQISDDLTYFIKADGVPYDMIVRLKKQIDMAKAMINANFKKTTKILETEKIQEGKTNIST
jgi:hypothetical protein|tara:strand:+ start:658 stop:960 length:303 start_codon:yes stop_codon:yes gene_type:complete